MECSRYGAKAGKRKAKTIQNIVERIFNKPVWEDYIKENKTKLQLQAESNGMLDIMLKLKAHEQIELLRSFESTVGASCNLSKERKYLFKTFLFNLTGRNICSYKIRHVLFDIDY